MEIELTRAAKTRVVLSQYLSQLQGKFCVKRKILVNMKLIEQYVQLEKRLVTGQREVALKGEKF